MSERRDRWDVLHEDGSREAVLRITPDFTPKPKPKPPVWPEMQAVIDTCNRAPEAMEELRKWALGLGTDESPARPE